MKRFFWICGVVLVMCTAATMYMASCESTYIKRWAPESVVIKGQFPLSGQLTTTRIHSPTGQGKFGKSDEIRYELQLQPDNEDGSWAPQVTEFLESQKQRKPRINFSNNDEGRMLGSTELNLQPEIIEEKTYYTARGSFGSPAAFKSATNWNIVWDEPMPTIPKAKYTGPIRKQPSATPAPQTPPKTAPNATPTKP
jgi:hypothetical protein